MNTVRLRNAVIAAMLALPLTALSAAAFAQPAPATPPDASNPSGTVSKPGSDSTATHSTHHSRTASRTTRHTTPKVSTQ